MKGLICSDACIEYIRRSSARKLYTQKKRITLSDLNNLANCIYKNLELVHGKIIRTCKRNAMNKSLNRCPSNCKERIKPTKDMILDAARLLINGEPYEQN